MQFDHIYNYQEGTDKHENCCYLLEWYEQYGGNGEWMRTWESDCDSAGVNLVCESVICTETPDDAALEACRALGKALVE